MDQNDVQKFVKQRFADYKKNIEESGEQKAFENAVQAYVPTQKQMMGQFIDNDTLAGGFTKAIPVYKQMGMDMEVVDISNRGMDAVVEVQKACPFLDMAREFGFEKPCRVVCEMDVASTKAAFDDMDGKIVSRVVDGDCVCLFKYERPQK
jgi:predicted ArsR family transcriptional regulator